MAALALTATGLAVYTASGDAYASKAVQGFQVLEGVEVEPQAPAGPGEKSGELECWTRPHSPSEQAEAEEPLSLY